VSKSVRGRYVDLMVRTGPNGGYVDVYDGTKLVRRIDTYSRRTRAASCVAR
jgi:hypothetical protein